MVGRLARRSGTALYQVAELLGWVPDVCYQVGVGMHHKEIDILREVWPTLRLVGFEPHPVTIQKIANHYPGTLLQTAIGSRDLENVPLYTKPRHQDGSSLHRPLPINENSTTYPVKVSRLDTLYPDGPDGEHVLLWLDCEGSEIDVLIGASEFLKKVEVINVEMTAKETYQDRSGDMVALHGELLRLGFKRQWIHTQRIHCGQYDGIYTRPYLFKPETCCCPCQHPGYLSRDAETGVWMVQQGSLYKSAARLIAESCMRALDHNVEDFRVRDRIIREIVGTLESLLDHAAGIRP